MDRIHTKLCSLREHLSWKRGGASQHNEETSEMPGESSNENYPITEDEEEEGSKKAFGVGDGDVRIIDTFDTEEPPYFAPPELSIMERIEKNWFKLLSSTKKPRQDVENLQMSIMYPPATTPMAPIVEVDEQAPESLNEGDIPTVQKKKHFVESTWAKSIINATPLKWFWDEKNNNNKTYANGIYWVCYAAPASGHTLTILDQYDPYTKNESIRTNLVIAISMFLVTAIANYFFKNSDEFLEFFESAAGMFSFFLVFGAMLAMHFSMFLIPRTRKLPVNFICLLIIIFLMSIITSFLTAKFKTYILLCAILVVCVCGVVHVFLATSRFDFRRFYLLFITTASAVTATIVISGLAFVVKWFDGPLQVMWLLIIGITISICLAMELTLIAQMKTLLLTDEDYCLGGYVLYMSSVDVFVRIVQILIRLDRY